MIAIGPIVLFSIYTLLIVMVISGMIRLRRFSLKCFDEYQRNRLELGKIAEEISLIRKNLEKHS